MPLHKLESGDESTMSFMGMETYVKENYMDSRERVTIFTQMSSQNRYPAPLPEFVFKGKGKHVTVHPPQGVKAQWSESGSYRLPHMIKTVNNLPTVVHWCIGEATGCRWEKISHIPAR